MSEFPELVGATGDIEADKKLFRVGAFELWAEIAGSAPKIAVHDITLNCAIGGAPTCSALLGVGLPFGSFVDDYRQIQASLASIDRGTNILIKITVLQQTFDDNSFLGKMIEPGTFLLFDGIVGGVNVQTAEDSQDIGLTVNLLHHTALRMASNTSLFGPFPPGSTNLQTVGAVYEADGGAGPNENLDANNVWDDWIAERLRWVLTKGNKFIDTKEEQLLDDFSEYAENQVKFLNQALADTVGNLPLRSEQGISEASRHNISQHITRFVIRGAKATNALKISTSLAEEFYFNIMGTARKLRVFPYWPYRKISEMLAIPAGSFIVTNHKSNTLISVGSFVGGAVVSRQIAGIYEGSQPDANRETSVAYNGAFKWKGISAAEKDYTTVDAVRCPGWLEQAYNPSPQDTSDSLDRSKYATPRPMHAPGEASPDEKLDHGAPIFDGVTNHFARFVTLEGVMKSDVIDVYMPLRFDIVPGKVLRLDQTTIERKSVTKESEALYGHVQSVMLRISAISRTAGVQALISHVHNHQTQQLIEDDEQGPFVYSTSYYDDLSDLLLVEDV